MKYIVYTHEGYTELPIGIEMDNCQIVDFVENTTETEFEIKSRYSLTTGIRYDNLIVVPFVDKKTIKAIHELMSFVRNSKALHKTYDSNEKMEQDCSKNLPNNILTALRIVTETFGQVDE